MDYRATNSGEIEMPTHLTEEERQAICDAISQKMSDDDKPPEMVIEEDYSGNREAYLRIMAGWHHIPIGVDRAILKVEALVAGFPPPVIDRMIVMLIVQNFTSEEILQMLKRLSELKQLIQARAEEEINALGEQLKTCYRSKGQLFCFWEDQFCADRQNSIRETAASRCYAIAQFMACLKAM